MTREISIYKEIKDDPAKARKYFVEFEDRMFDPNEIRQALQKI